MTDAAQGALRGVSPFQREALRRALAPLAGQVRSVGLFGSRATGRAKPFSDIDLVLYGAQDRAVVDRARTLMKESALDVGVDVVGYEFLDDPALRAHIDAVMAPLFSQDDLRGGA